MSKDFMGMTDAQRQVIIDMLKAETRRSNREDLILAIVLGTFVVLYVAFILWFVPQ